MRTFCWQAVPFKFFRWMVGGKWDDRISHLDHMLAKVLLADSSSDPKELQNHMKALVKAWAKRAAKNKVAKAKAKVTGSSKARRRHRKRCPCRLRHGLRWRKRWVGGCTGTGSACSALLAVRVWS